MKRCKKCGRLKPHSEFYRSKGMADGHRSDCKACNLAAKRLRYRSNPKQAIARVRAWQQENREKHNAWQRAYRNSHKEQAREGHLRRTFGISQSDYDDLLARQGGGCAICGRPPTSAALHVDHNHESGVVRGLLCVGCNNALGQFKDSIELLARASNYLVCGLLTIEDVGELDELAMGRAGELRTTSV